MTIGFDAKRALNNPTGLGNHARILLNALMRDFSENKYLLFSPKAEEKFFNELTGDFQIIFPETKFQKAFHPLWRSAGVKNQLLKNRVEVYHGLSNEIPFGLTGYPMRSVVTIHDLIFLKHAEQYPFIDRRIYELKTKYAAKNADAIIAVSNETKNDLIERYKVAENRITVIYPSVDSIFQQPENQISKTDVVQKYQLPDDYILNVGSFFPRKNQKTLVEAFDLIKNKISKNLVLAGGSGNMHSEIEMLIKKKKLQGRVKIVPGISNQDMPLVFRAASVFVFPSLYEGFGAPVLEALFSKVPVITTKGGAMEEAGGKHSLYVNPLSAEEIAEAILKIVNNESLKKQMVENGYAHAQTMTDSAFAEKTMQVYKAVTS